MTSKVGSGYGIGIISHVRFQVPILDVRGRRE
jgi:hypothetical protein